MLLSTHHVALILAAAGSALTAPTGPAAVQDTASDIRLTGGMCHIDIFREEPLEIHGSKEPFVLQAAIYDDGNNKKGELLRTRCQATTDTGGQRCTFRSGIADEFASLSPIFKKADETPERDYVEVTLGGHTSFGTDNAAGSYGVAHNCRQVTYLHESYTTQIAWSCTFACTPVPDADKIKQFHEYKPEVGFVPVTDGGDNIEKVYDLEACDATKKDSCSQGAFGTKWW